MPVLKHPISELYNSVTRPVAVNVVRHVMRLTGIPQETSIMYIGDSGASLLEGASVEGSDQPARFSQTNKVYVEVTEETIPEATLSRYTHQFEQLPIFRDAALDVSYYPIYARTRQTISLKFRTEDRGTAQRWRNGIQVRLSQDRLHHAHEINYHYLVPANCVALLVELYNKRQAVAPYQDTLQEWIRANMTPKAVTLVNAAGAQGRLAIKEKQIRVIGRFDFETPTQEEKDDRGAVYTASVDYVVEYDQPISLVTRFPISVHSQLVDEKYWGDYQPYTAEYSQALASCSINALARVVATQTTHNHNPAVAGYVYPAGDDWLPARTYRGCSTVARFLATPNDAGDTLLNLNDLGDLTLKSTAIRYLKREYRTATDERDSPVFVKVHEGKEELHPTEYYVDQDLNVKTNTPLDPRKVYHVVIGAVTNFSTLSPAGRDVAKQNPGLIADITGDTVPLIPGSPGAGDSDNPSIDPNTTVDPDGNNGIVDPDYWDRITNVSGADLARRTVASYTIVTHRGE